MFKSFIKEKCQIFKHESGESRSSRAVSPACCGAHVHSLSVSQIVDRSGIQPPADSEIGQGRLIQGEKLDLIRTASNCSTLTLALCCHQLFQSSGGLGGHGAVPPGHAGAVVQVALCALRAAVDVI